MNHNMNLLTNLPYFDFNEAIDNYGFDFNQFSENGFAKFLTEVYLECFIEFRKSYIRRNFELLRFFAHKFKGSFLLMQSDYIADKCKEMQKLIDIGNIEVEDLYVELVHRMMIFLDKIVELSKKTEIKLNEKIMREFQISNDICNDMEDRSAKLKLFPEFETSASYKDHLPQSSLNMESTEDKCKACCSLCLLY